MNIRACAKNVHMRMKGYTPIKLKDVNNALKGTQKYKYVKADFGNKNFAEKNYNSLMKEMVLPSGTIVRHFLPPIDAKSKYTKVVINPKTNMGFHATLEMINGKLQALLCKKVYKTNSRLFYLKTWAREENQLVRKHHDVKQVFVVGHKK